MLNNTQNKSKRIAVGGILIALTIIVLFFATVLPTSRLALFTLSSFLVAVIVIEFGIKFAWIFYIACSILSFLSPIPNKIELIFYVAFFGYYPMVKFYVERINIIFIEYILKLLAFNVGLFLILKVAKEILFRDINIQVALWVLIVIAQIAFFLYDYLFTLFIQYYNNKLRRMLEN